MVTLTGKYGHGKSKYYLKDNIVWTEKRYWKAYIERNAFCFWPGEWKETQGSWKITGTRRERGDSGDVSTCAEGPDRKMSGNKTLEIEVSWIHEQHDDRNIYLPRHRCANIIQFSSVTQSCPTLWDSMNCSTPGLPVHHQLPEFTQTHVHWVGDTI